MLSRNRLLNATVRGCIAAILCAYLSVDALAQPIRDSPAAQPGTNKTQEKPQTDNTPLALEAIKSEMQRIGRATEALKDSPDPKKEDREQRDVDAQEQMAYWAWAMFVAAAVSVVLTAVGLILILGTLLYTRNAVSEAREGNKIARQAERPWLAIESVAATDDFTSKAGSGIQLSVGITLKNSGRSPAVNVRATCEILPHNTPDRDAALQAFAMTLSPAENFNKHVVFPNARSSDGIITRITRDYIEAAPPPYNSDRKYILPQIMVCVRYQSPGDDTIRHTSGLYEIGPIYIGEGKIAARSFDRSPFAKSIAD